MGSQLLTGPVTLLIAASLLVPVAPVSDYRIYFESIRAPAYAVLIVMQLQQIPLLYLLFDVPVFHTLHLGSLIIVAGFVIGLAARKSSVDMVLVSVFILAVLAGLLVTNDHQLTREVLESARLRD